MSPVAGIMSDRINPKIPTFIGIVLLAASLYLNSRLSLSTEHRQIMLALYVRGLGLGLVFTPLSTIALSEIPRDKMAQASGLFNVIRQIGGSFGVALLGTMLTRRTIFHTAMFGQAVDVNSPAYRHAASVLQQFAQHTAGGTASDASIRAAALIGSNVSRQAFIQAINDDFLIAAGITIVVTVPVLLLRTRKRSAGMKMAAAE
jgi:DHA2 family multidrug resistance protein